MRKFIGSDARDYWYDEALHYYDHINYYAKINDSYFSGKPFEGPEYYKNVLTWRIKYWKDLTEKDDLYRKQLSIKIRADKKFMDRFLKLQPNIQYVSEDELINNRYKNLIYPPKDQFYSSVTSRYFIDGETDIDDLNDKEFIEYVRKLRDDQYESGESQYETDCKIGSEQDRLLANYLQKFEDNQTRLNIACYSY